MNYVIDVEITFAGTVVVEADDEVAAYKAVRSQLARRGVMGLDGTLEDNFFERIAIKQADPQETTPATPDMYARRDDR